VRIRLLGGFGVSVGSRSLEGSVWRLRKAAHLVKLLALSSGHRMHREQVMEVLWPDLGSGAAANNLRQILHSARRILGTDPSAASRYLALRDEQLVLCPEGNLWVDVEAFEEAAAAARRSKDPAGYRTAIELYAGELLPEDRYEEWAQGRREELRRLHLALLVELANLYEERGEHEPAFEALRRVVAEEPGLEEGHVGLMRLYALSGRHQEALSQYKRLRDALSGHLSTEPGATTRALHDEIAAGRFPPPQPLPTAPLREGSLDTEKHNLPAPRTSFVGREREMVEVKPALAMTRLLTLTGAGGSGKTRLALEMARDLTGIYPDGVWLVELAGLSEGELVPQAVAGALAVRESPGQPLTDTLVDTLRAKEMLLVMDNCEHLLDSAAWLADTLLDSCPHLRVLATSREPLDVEGEVLWRVPPLSSPEADEQIAAADLTRYDAARLFVERTRLRSPDFEVTPDSIGAITQICRRLDGIPLAIELAAARMGALSVEQIAERLNNSLKLLTGGGRTAIPRQRTLRGALDWSHGLFLGRRQLMILTPWPLFLTLRL
jgi:DNA-binding SARP family transcriptional activator